MASTAKHDWPMVRLGDVCELKYGKALKKENRVEGEYRVFGSAGSVGTHVEANFVGPVSVVGRKGSAGFVEWSSENCWIIDTAFGVFPKSEEQVDSRWLYWLLKDLRLGRLQKHAAVPGISKTDVVEEEFLLPPLEEQRRIAAILDEARGQRDKYAGAGTLLGTMTSNWLSLRSQSIPRMKLSELGTFRGGMTPSKKNSEYWGGDVPWFTTKDLKFAEVYESEDRITHRALDETSASLIGEPSIAFSLRGMSLAHRLPMSCIPGEVTVNQDLKAFVPNQSKDRDVLFYLVKLREKELLSKVSSSAHGTKKLDFRHLNELEVPDPSGEFGSEVRRVLEQIRDMQEQIRRRQETSMTLFQALSTRAFQGEL
ncbi:TPA: restriction endonuclease subunit S [Corynebacterium striatum]|nr:restriction endonuclease subunit S [Corynebacterium striatum]